MKEKNKSGSRNREKKFTIFMMLSNEAKKFWHASVYLFVQDIWKLWLEFLVDFAITAVDHENTKNSDLRER